MAEKDNKIRGKEKKLNSHKKSTTRTNIKQSRPKGSIFLLCGKVRNEKHRLSINTLDLTLTSLEEMNEDRAEILPKKLEPPEGSEGGMRREKRGNHPERNERIQSVLRALASLPRFTLVPRSFIPMNGRICTPL